MRSLLTVALLVASISSSVAEPGLAISEEDLGAKLDTLLVPWDQSDAPGMAVLVQSRGTDIYRRCIGLADLEQGIKITPLTCFDLASVSKHLTAFGLCLLAEEGRLNLDDPIRRYLPELPLCAEPVLVRHLVHQSSGFWEFWTILNKYSGFQGRDYLRLSDVLTLLAGQSALNFAPGSRYAYTNTNYSLLSLVIERAGGIRFGIWMRDHVFTPLGMTGTLIQTECTELIPHRATAYLSDAEGYRLARPSNVEIPGSAHAFTNLEDMSRWLSSFHDKRLGGDRIFECITKPGVLNDGTQMNYAGGLIVSERKRTKTIQHSGQTGGFKTMLIYCPEEELGVVILANARSINAAGLAFEILDICRGLEPPRPAGETTEEPTLEPESFTPDVALLDSYTGGYRLQPDGGHDLHNGWDGRCGGADLGYGWRNSVGAPREFRI
ncbi:MAG: beta-lactamase family protein [Candidatus Eisenbacteria bacterium]|uniref:Beta-lactamase family protein n=1 Tax=Eiseniibacteriota bacterium TaxID=2212470 RepID=A0A948W2C0_UNCEI|nr:beta-lactamase family protein [Candidatus Eisenbacteria bacterium]MBU1948119.1 beta-lactamase family protein [Candidatus Eisenbacteria bacterium]MBU2689782.1 beta-lactamase family protein [Candidatus Eisenbacteria bacterium]